MFTEEQLHAIIIQIRQVRYDLRKFNLPSVRASTRRSKTRRQHLDASLGTLKRMVTNL